MPGETFRLQYLAGGVARINRGMVWFLLSTATQIYWVSYLKSPKLPRLRFERSRQKKFAISFIRPLSSSAPNAPASD